jgi:hypothetical protein
LNLYIRCECAALHDEPLTARAARVTALLASPEMAHVAGERWSAPSLSKASAADAPEPIHTLADLRAWSPAPATDDVAYRLARTNGRDGDRRCEVVATLWMEGTAPDQLVLRIRRDRFPGGKPSNLEDLVDWLKDRVRGAVEIGEVDRYGVPGPLAAK